MKYTQGMFTLSDIFTSSNDEPGQLAAIDLGSNSFHMIIAQWHRGQLNLIDRLKDPVRLGWGLNEDGTLVASSYDCAMACLDRFGERLRGFNAGSVRVVGTKTLRSIKDKDQFLRDAEARLGHPVDIISGEEEARLIYLGVGHCLAPAADKRLLVDIGGGSTEVMIGTGNELKFKASLNMGCVAITKRYFSDNAVTDLGLARAHIRCLQQIVPVRDRFDNNIIAGDSIELLGASGTIKAVSKVCIAEGWSGGDITLQSLKLIKQRYLEVGSLSACFKGLTEDRQPVFLGGVCVLDALFEGLNFERLSAAGMQPSPWALREGLLYDLKGRLENCDIRDDSINALAKRFHVDLDKMAAVEKTAIKFFHQLKGSWSLQVRDAENLLCWAVRLYTVGLDIRHSDYHKHSAYIVENVDLAGCTQREQQQLAALVLAHRKRFPTKLFPMDNTPLVHLAILLRLSVIFHRGKNLENSEHIYLSAEDQRLWLSLPQGWRDKNPLNEADLLVEQIRLKDIGVILVIAGG